MAFAKPSAPRIVLDTNVCLDLWVFADPRCAPLRAALCRGAVHAVTRADCCAEWQRVLHYPGLPIDDQSRPAIAAAFAANVQVLAGTDAASARAACLPRCADPDDQKFMELALAAGARWLLSKDRELLKLSRRTQVAGGFSILSPQAWTPSCPPETDAGCDAAPNQAMVTG